MMKKEMLRLIALAVVEDGLVLEERMNAKKAHTTVVVMELHNS
jgi:hypothetical protein